MLRAAFVAAMQLAPSGRSASTSAAAVHRFCKQAKRKVRTNGLLVKEPFTSRPSNPSRLPQPELDIAEAAESQQPDSGLSEMTATGPTADQLFLAKAWNFLAGSSGAFIMPYIPLLLSQHGMSATQIGLLAALRPWLAAPSQMTASALADQHKVHAKLLLGACLASCVLRASLPLSDSAALLFVLLLASEATGAPVNVLADSTVLSNCKDAGDYGKQRVWASIGWGAASLPAGWLISKAGIASGFLAYSLAAVPLIYVASQMRYNYGNVAAALKKQQQQHPKHGADGVLAGMQHSAGRLTPAGADVRAAGGSAPAAEQQPGVHQLLLQPAVLSFLWKCLLMGFGIGVMGTYEFLWLKQLGAPETLMGMALLMNVCTEVPAFQMQGAIMKRMSAPNLLNLVLAVTVLRLAAYAVLPAAGNPWAVLPVELTHGITFGVGFSTATVYSIKLAPPHLAATFQGMWQATYAGIGAGVGGLVGGVLMEHYGGQGMFITAATIVAAGGLMGALAELLSSKPLQPQLHGHGKQDRAE